MKKNETEFSSNFSVSVVSDHKCDTTTNNSLVLFGRYMSIRE